jgi:phage terminase large subunit GpA-like protein
MTTASTLTTVLTEAAAGWRPPPDVVPVEWGEANIVLGDWAAKRGPWRVKVTPYTEEIINRFSIRDRYRKITVQFAAQLAKTTALAIGLFYSIACRPRPAMIVQPKDEAARDFSKRELAGMIRESPILRRLISQPKAKDSDNTTQNKGYPGGRLYICGAASPTNLASKPIGDLLLDEVDRYPESAGTEGDPVDLAVKRTATFPTRKIVMTSTPGNEGASRIEDSLLEGDMRHYWVPCPHCGAAQVLIWAQVRWERSQPDTAHYECCHCAERIEQHHLPDMLAEGSWVPMDHDNQAGECAYCRDKIGPGAHEPKDPTNASYHMSALYSPWQNWSEHVSAFLRAKGDPERLKTWVNTVLGETWRDTFGEGMDHEGLMLRRERYQLEVPQGVMVLTFGTDVQLDRLETEITGWGIGKESWRIAYVVLMGNPGNLDDQCWNLHDNLIMGGFDRGAGDQLSILGGCIDTGGGRSMNADGSTTQATYAYLKRWRGHNVFGIKGRASDPTIREPIWPKAPSQVRTRAGTTVPLHTVRTDIAKDVHYARLKIEEPGPGYCHFPIEADETYFKGLVAEVKKPRLVRGRNVYYWHLPQHRRNEPLDCRVYNICALEALESLGLVDLSSISGNSERVRAESIQFRDSSRSRSRRRRGQGANRGR